MGCLPHGQKEESSHLLRFLTRSDHRAIPVPIGGDETGELDRIKGSEVGSAEDQVIQSASWPLRCRLHSVLCFARAQSFQSQSLQG